MQSSTVGIRLRLLGLGVVPILMASMVAADEPTKTVDAGGLVFTVPAAWKSVPVSNAMQKEKLKIEPVKGDDDGAELIITALPGAAGGVEMNVARWEKTFKDKDGNQAKAEVKKVKGQNVEVSRVEIAGHYTPANFGGPKQPDKPNARLLGAIVITDSNGYFLRLIGPEKTVNAAKADFDKMIASMKADGK
jgi:hypothetical protein